MKGVEGRDGVKQAAAAALIAVDHLVNRAPLEMTMTVRQAFSGVGGVGRSAQVETMALRAQHGGYYGILNGTMYPIFPSIGVVRNGPGSGLPSRNTTGGLANPNASIEVAISGPS
jgi:hypothetical protein